MATIVTANMDTTITALKRRRTIQNSESRSEGTITTTSTCVGTANCSRLLYRLSRARTSGQKYAKRLDSNSHAGPNERNMPLQVSSRSFTDSFATLSPIYDHEISSDPTFRPATSATVSNTYNTANSGHLSTSPSNMTTASASDRSATAIPSRTNGTGAVQSQQSNYFYHRDSISTSASGSSCSSPTTTASLADLMVSQETPGTSPDTPASSQSLSYPSLSLALRAPPDGKPDLAKATTLAPPSKKPRNLKNLAVNTSTPLGIGRAINTAALPLENSSSSMLSPAIASPKMSTTFVKPMQPPRKKASTMGLTIQTPSTESHPPHALQIDRQVPPTPSLIRPSALRSFQSSPSLSLLTSRFSPEKGMCLPPPINSGVAQSTVFSPLSESPAEHDEDEDQPNFDIPQSREEKPDAYPDGPICIYDPLVYLFFEPTAEQASTFDVIFNVASEVLNPYSGPEYESAPVVSRTLSEVVEEMDKGLAPGSEGATEADKESASKVKRPEYIHVPWEHNTDIVPDLHKLVKVMDQRVQQGKRVLVHCQCGVSRSASFIVAYGLYKQPTLMVQEAYDAVKKRSKWIGPNMNLVMQLQEFRSGLSRPNGSEVSMRGPIPNHAITASDSGIPRTAPLLPGIGKTIPKPIKVEGHDRVAPGPSSAPSGLQWPSSDESNGRAHASSPETSPPQRPANQTRKVELESSYVDATGKVISPAAVARVETSPMKRTSRELSSLSLTSPQVHVAAHGRPVPPPLMLVRQTSSATLAGSPIESPRSADFGMTSYSAPALDETFGITSPRSEVFGNSSPVSVHQQAFSTSPTLDSIASPRSTEFGMTAFNPPEMDDTVMLGLTSPRVTGPGTSLFETAFESTVQKSVAHPEPYMPPVPNYAPPPPPPASSATSQPTAAQDGVPTCAAKLTAIYPTEETLQSSMNAHARAELRSQLGLSSKTSHTNLRGSLAGAAEKKKKKPPQVQALQLSMAAAPSLNSLKSPSTTAPRQAPPPTASRPRSLRSVQSSRDMKSTAFTLPSLSELGEQNFGAVSDRVPMLPLLETNRTSTSNDYSEALMSPRATEFTNNPFHPKLHARHSTGALRSAAQRQDNAFESNTFNFPHFDGLSAIKGLEHDPRSPAQKGQNPIVRNILDVFTT